MYTVIIFASISMVIFFIKREYLNPEWHSIYEIIVMRLMELLLGALIGGLTGGIVSFAFPIETISKTETKPIELLNDNSGLNGSFFLGSGSINEEMVYVYYEKQNNGRYSIKKIFADRAEIEYSNETPSVVREYHTKTDYWSNKFSLRPVKKDTYVFKIPKGSILNSYQLNGQ